MYLSGELFPHEMQKCTAYRLFLLAVHFCVMLVDRMATWNSSQYLQFQYGFCDTVYRSSLLIKKVSNEIRKRHRKKHI